MSVTEYNFVQIVIDRLDADVTLPGLVGPVQALKRSQGATSPYMIVNLLTTTNSTTKGVFAPAVLGFVSVSAFAEDWLAAYTAIVAARRSLEGYTDSLVFLTSTIIEDEGSVLHDDSGHKGFAEYRLDIQMRIKKFDL